MADEQIKQNAEAYAGNSAKHLQQPYEEYKLKYDAYIAGAHSRDEEIEELRSSYHDMFCILANKVEQLRNPWISVHERLPEEHQDVLIEKWNGSVIRNDYISIGDINYMKDNPELFLRWMLTPKPGLN